MHIKFRIDGLNGDICEQAREKMENWDEIRTAFQVARAGTVSGAAEVLGVHHATVIRHIDALEQRLGTRLFQRHPRGYTATEAGQDLLRVAQTTEDQFAQLAARINGAGREMGGELTVTSLPGLSPLVTPVLVQMQLAHPALIMRYVTDLRVYRLEYGEAHVAIRGGRRPEEPDNIVQPLLEQSVALYASPDYIARNGSPADDSDLAGHRFVGSDSEVSRAPFLQWLGERVDRAQITYRTNEMQSMEEAVVAGAGLGFMTRLAARRYPDVVEVMGPRPEWTSALWIVTHVDLHRTAKVQAFLTALKEASRSCPAE